MTNPFARLDEAIPSLTVSSLQEALARRNEEWDPPSGSPGLMFRAIEMGGEVGEALNKIKKLEREWLGMRGSRATVEEVGEELADVVITALLVAIELGV